MKKILNYLPILTICFFFIGFNNIYFYYKEFNIQIYSFVSNIDLLLLFLPKISTLAGTIVVIGIGNISSNSTKHLLINNEENSKPIKIPEVKYVALFYLLIQIIFITISLVFSFKTYTFLFAFQFVDLIFIIAFYSSIKFHNPKNIEGGNQLIIGIFLLSFIAYKIGTYSQQEAFKLKDGIKSDNSKNMDFYYKNMHISTNDTNIYIGQTSSHIFLYDRKDSTTKVYELNNVDNLCIKGE